MAKKLTSTKAKQILHDKEVHGHPLTDKQRKFFGAVASGAVPKAQEGTPVKSFYKDAEDKKQYQNAIQNWYRNTLPNLSREERLSIIPEESIKRSLGENDTGLRCIGGACSIMKKHGKTFNAGNVEGIYTGNGTFETNAFIKNLEDVYQVDGNYQIGDLIQVPPKKGLYGDTKLIVDINDGKIITYGGVSGGDISPGTVYTPEELSRYVKDGTRRVVRPGYQLDRELLQKERKAKTSPEARKAINQRKENIAYQEGFNPGYQYSVREDSELYGNEPEGVKEFLKLANDDTRVTDIIKRLDKAGLASKADKLSVHNSLLNVFGILGQENKFENRLFGGDFGVENLIERNIYDGLIPTPGAEGNLSIGPGQIKFSSINPEIRKAFGIKKPKDLYNWDKVLPLMVGMDISNRKWMENQGEKLSERIIGEPGAGSTDMIWDEARMSPYFWQGPGIPNLREFLSKKYDEYVEGYRIPKKVKEAQREEYISKNIRKYQKVFDPESYGQKVYENINKNLQRTSPNLEKEQTLQEIVVPIKKKKKNGGWLDAYEDVPQAQNGIEGTMGGLTDVGFDYNGAWGGTMAMGGSLPGSVGFTYAREGAPSNGPYAKKTKASAQDGKKLSYSQWKKQYNLKETPDYNLKRAWELGYIPDKSGHLPTVDNQTGQFLKAKGHPTLQLELDWYNSPEAADFRSKNIIDSSGKFFKYVPKSQNGMEMKYYQEGLDFQPKTISRDGSDVPKAQTGISSFMPEGLRKLPTNVAASTYVAPRQRNIMTAEEAEAAARAQDFYERIENQPILQPATRAINTENTRRKNKQYAQQQGLKYNELTGAVEPLVSANTERTMNRAYENIVEPMLEMETIASAAPLVGLGLKTAEPFIRKGLNAASQYAKNKVINPSLRLVKQTAEEIDRKYIYPLQYKKQISELQNIHNSAAQRYGSGEGAKRLNAVLGIDPLKMEQPHLTTIPREGSHYESFFNNINIDFRQAKKLKNKYLLSPKSIYEHEYGHFLQREANRFSDEYANKLKKYEKALAKYNSSENQKILNAPVDDPNSWIYNRSLVQLNPGLKPKPSSAPTKIDKYANRIYDVNPDTRELQNISYTSINNEKSLKIYENSQYFIRRDLEQFAHLREMRQNMIDKGYIKSQYDPISAETIAKFVKENPKDRISSFTDVNNPKVIAGLEKIFRNLPAAVPPAIGASVATSNFEQKKKGGEIKKDDMGYWNPENWGKPVEIDSNEITMQGVYEPLLGVSDTGDVQMMYPGEDYTFDGESVTEYPVARRGTSVNNADAQPIKKLNQLMDFSNYNKPTKGGWLSKYE